MIWYRKSTGEWINEFRIKTKDDCWIYKNTHKYLVTALIFYVFDFIRSWVDIKFVKGGF